MFPTLWHPPATVINDPGHGTPGAISAQAHVSYFWVPAKGYNLQDVLLPSGTLLTLAWYNPSVSKNETAQRGIRSAALKYTGWGSTYRNCKRVAINTLVQ